MVALMFIALLVVSLFGHHVAGIASAGCGRHHSVKVETTYDMDLGDRRYLLWFPENYESTEPAPLILSYHGGNEDAEDQQRLDLLNTTYFNKDYIVVYPNAIDKTWQGVPDVDNHDVNFTSNILDELEARYCIDTDRIYATGKSQGAGFVGLLACNDEMSSRMAAFAPVSGAFYVCDGYGDECDPETVPIIPCNPSRGDIPILEFHGLADTSIDYYGGDRRGVCLPSIPHWVQSWAERDGLSLKNETSKVPGADENSTAVRYEFGNGTAKGLVTHIMDGEGIGHDWPSTEPNKDNTRSGHEASAFNASSIIIDFFDAHPLFWSLQAHH